MKDLVKLNFAQGYKTYAVCAAMLIYAAIGWYFHYNTQEQSVQMIFNALALVGLRKAVS